MGPARPLAPPEAALDGRGSRRSARPRSGPARSPGRPQASPFDPRGDDWEGLSQLVRMAQAELGPQHVSSPPRLDLRELETRGRRPHRPPRAAARRRRALGVHAGGRAARPPRRLRRRATGSSRASASGACPCPRGPRRCSAATPRWRSPSRRARTRRSATSSASSPTTRRASSTPPCRRCSSCAATGSPTSCWRLAGAVGQGRLLAVGDASLGINAMMRYPGNRALCAALVRYVTEDDAWGKRGRQALHPRERLRDHRELRRRLAASGGAAGDAAPDARATPWRCCGTTACRRSPRTSSRSRWASASSCGRARARAGRTSAAVPRFVRRVPPAAQGGVAGHAAVIAAPGTSRVLAMLELKSALEEDLATRLGPRSSAAARRARREGRARPGCSTRRRPQTLDAPPGSRSRASRHCS